MQRILVVNVNWLGDVIFSSPVFYALRAEYPDAHIACMAVPRVREILESIEPIDEIIEFDEDHKDKSVWAKLKFAARLKRLKYDAAFLLSRSFSRASILAMAKIPVRVGYEHKGRGKLLTHVYSNDAKVMHRSDYYLGVIKSFGIPVKNIETRLQVDPSDRQYVDDELVRESIAADEFLVALNPGGNWDLKRWPPENFAGLMSRLGMDSTIRVIMTGGPNDRSLVEKICRKAGAVQPIILTGKLNLKQLIALMQRIDVFVTADSGPLHIASSVGCATVSMFGPTRPELTGPRGRGTNITLNKDLGCNRHACYHLDCNDNICMQSVTVEEVYESIKQIQNS